MNPRAPFPASSSLAALTLAAVLGGCSLMPEYQRPPAPVPAAFPNAPAAQADTPAAADIAWRDYFVDARLQRVIEQALANNRDLRIAALNIEAARAQYGIQRADLFPAVGATASQTAQRQPAGVFSEAGGGTTGGVSRQLSATIGFSAYELDFFGRIRSLNAEALETYLATGDARRSAQISLIAETASTWLSLAADQERLTLAQRTLKARDDSYRLTRRSFDAGAISALELRQAETLMLGARADLAALQSRIAQDANALALIVGTPVDRAQLPEALPGEAGRVTALIDLPAGVASTVLTTRPDVAAAERALRAANARIGAARAAFFPSISLTASAGTASRSLSDLFSSGSGTWLFAPQIRVPIFEAGRLRASLDVANIQRDIGVARYEKAIQQAFREVADALAERATLAEQRAAREQLVEATAESLELSDLRYQAGADSYLVLLDAQREQYSAEQALIDVRQADAANRVTLYKVLGGGVK